MKLLRVKITGYRSIRDTGEFSVEDVKTILVGPNEAGKTAVLRAIQALNPPNDEGKFTALRDFPRSEYSKIQKKAIDPAKHTVTRGVFSVDPSLRENLREIDAALFSDVQEVVVGRLLNNERWITIPDVEPTVIWSAIKKDIAELRTSVEKAGADPNYLTELDSITESLNDSTRIEATVATSLAAWLEKIHELVGGDETARLDAVSVLVNRSGNMEKARELIASRLPKFVYYSNIYRTRPRIHLRQLAEREETGTTDPEYDFGNLCLLKLLGLSAAELAAQGDVSKPEAQDREAQNTIQDQLDERMYALNAAAAGLTEVVRSVWGEPTTLEIRVDQDYLKVAARDELGVEVELDQKSAGFQWLVSFYVVFKAQSADELSNAILLLDEPALSLHALKQQEFRKTVSILAEDNQTIYTTHSPFMVGPDELPLVRVVDMKSREAGTKVHTGVIADDPAALFPLQAAFGYLLSQTLFAHAKNLVTEGITDLFYIESMSSALRDSGRDSLDEEIALVPAGDAGQVVYFSVLLHTQQLKTAALLDSDQAGDNAAIQDNLVELLKPRRIHRTKDYYKGVVKRPEIEDLLRTTLVKLAKEELGLDVASTANKQRTRPIMDVFEDKDPGFSKYRLARRFVSWLGTHSVSDLTTAEQTNWEAMFAAINKSLK